MKWFDALHLGVMQLGIVFLPCLQIHRKVCLLILTK